MSTNVQPLKFRDLKDGPVTPGTARAKNFVPYGKKETVPAPPPPPPVYKQEDIKAAEAEGYKKGFLEGAREGQKQAENEQAQATRELIAMLEGFVKAVTPLFQDYRRSAVQVRQDVPKVALAIARKVAADALDERAIDVISEISGRCCEALTGEQKIAITVHESLGDLLQQRLSDLAAQLPEATHIIIQRDPDMTKSNCRIEWKNGSLERNTEQLWQQIEKAVNDLSFTAARQTEEHMQQVQQQLPAAQEPPVKKE